MTELFKLLLKKHFLLPSNILEWVIKIITDSVNYSSIFGFAAHLTSFRLSFSRSSRTENLQSASLANQHQDQELFTKMNNIYNTEIQQQLQWLRLGLVVIVLFFIWFLFVFSFWCFLIWCMITTIYEILHTVPVLPGCNLFTQGEIKLHDTFWTLDPLAWILIYFSQYDVIKS